MNPLLYSVGDDSTPTTRIWLDYSSDEVPEWLSVTTANEVYTDSESSFDLVFEAEALPEGVAGRSAHLVFVQEGAKLEVFVSQGESSGIHAVVTKVENNAPAYNLAGQRVNNGYKGIVVKGSKKFVNK